MKAVVAAFNQKKARRPLYSVIVQLLFPALSVIRPPTVYFLPRKGLLAHLQTQQEGKRNQSMKTPAQSLLGS